MYEQCTTKGHICSSTQFHIEHYNSMTHIFLIWLCIEDSVHDVHLLPKFSVPFSHIRQLHYLFCTASKTTLFCRIRTKDPSGIRTIHFPHSINCTVFLVPIQTAYEHKTINIWCSQSLIYSKNCTELQLATQI